MSIRWFPLFSLLLLNVSGCVTADILIGLSAIGGLSETLNISPFYVILGFFCLIILVAIIKDSIKHGKNNLSPELKIGIGVILAVIVILCFIPGRAPAKPTKLQPKQGTVATEKERLIYTDPQHGRQAPRRRSRRHCPRRLISRNSIAKGRSSPARSLQTRSSAAWAWPRSSTRIPIQRLRWVGCSCSSLAVAQVVDTPGDRTATSAAGPGTAAADSHRRCGRR